MKRIVLSSLFMGALWACSPGAAKCTTFADCSDNQVCIMGECRGGQAAGGSSGTTGAGGAQSGGSTGTTGGSQGGGEQGGGAGGADGGGLMEDDAGTSTYDGGGCGPPVPGNPPIPRLCATATANECAGPTDSALTGGGVPATRLNGTNGNGFDDDCDGLVDEGCFCPSNGVTKDCYLVPATQVDATSGKPVGWCAVNAKGSLDCAGGELASWSGVCRGAQPPASSDSCAPGDFNCDGLDSNNRNEGCMCSNSVQCPSAAITTAPYPTATSILSIDGSAWVTDAAARARTTNWAWTVLGGDCDNVLPNPTFAIYNQANSTVAGARKGTRTPVRLDTTLSPARYVTAANSPLIGMVAKNFGNGAAGGHVYPAFALSGDYIVQGEFTLDGQVYSCTQKVQVRAPGIRAELCWDTVGPVGLSGGNDIDLHFARLQGTSATSNGWNGISGADCYYANRGPMWGYAASATSACKGWGSRQSSPTCNNPRLDQDNISCDKGVLDPSSPDFCGPENINLDNPTDGQSFVVGVNHYANHGGTANAKPHVNLYCNGERVVSVGYNPATGQTQFPLLSTPGRDAIGDFWTVATIQARVTGGTLSSCQVTTIPSRRANAALDGPPTTGMTGNDKCVDHYTGTTLTRNFVDANTGQGLPAGALPMTAAQWCKH
jgi:hypothetical protein